MDPEEWRFTRIGELHPEIPRCLSLEPEELAVVSAFLSPGSWYVFTTRRVVSHLDGETQSLDPSGGLREWFGNFKGIGEISCDVAILSAPSGARLRVEYETGKASMAPIYAARYWSQKHPILHKLLTTEERELYRSKRV
ncbi:MAG: hypothetical protein EOP83_02345 [Verrucomicrobiaceae bacterium]|nr:MAG: hypothetical protein EOP83_02345 [Verrucomicrobiaceae bacterium]